MFSHIKTSKENKDVVTQLTNKLNLGAENVIARIALTYSLGQGEKLDLKDLKDSGGKEYSKSVLFGEFFNVYIGLICTKHDLYKTDKDLSKFVKLYIDEGLSMLNTELEEVVNIDNFIFQKIKNAIVNLN